MKLQVYLDDWLIRADTPEQAQLHAQTTIRVLQFLSWIIKYEKSDLTPSPAVLQGLPLATKQTEVTLFTDVSSSGWGAQLGSCSTQGQWSASQRSWHINVLEMQAVINAVGDFLPHLRSRVVRLMCDNTVTGLHQERGRHKIVHTNADDDTPAQVVRSQGNHVGSRPSARSAQHSGGFAFHAEWARHWTLSGRWPNMEHLRPVFAKWGEPQVDLFATFANRWLLKFVFVGLRPVIQILCHVLARGWGRWQRYFTEAKAEVKYRASARIRGPKHDTRFEWPVSILIMTRYPFLPLQNSQNKCQKYSFTYDRRHHLILPLPPVHALPTLNARTCCLGAPIDDVTISYFRSHGQFESSVNASCQRITMWIIRTSSMYID